MAHLRCDFFSEALGQSTSMTVLLPQQTSAQIGMTGRTAGGPAPVLYLLHGLSDDDTTWLRRTSIERYVAELGWAVVMPQVHRSFYADEHTGARFWEFVSAELPALVSDFFRVSTAREDTFVAGLSMGGYGAVKLALRQPERFAAAASLSGVLDLAAVVRSDREWPSDPRMWERVLGPGRRVGPDDDLIDLVGRTDPERLPDLYACCGTEDELLAGNQVFADACDRAGVALTTSWTPGVHDWAYWDAMITEVLGFLADTRAASEAAA